MRFMVGPSSAKQAETKSSSATEIVVVDGIGNGRVQKLLNRLGWTTLTEASRISLARSDVLRRE